MTALASLLVVIAIVVLLGAVALMSAAEASVLLLPRPRIRRLAESGEPGGHAVGSLAERPGRLLAAHAVLAAFAYSTSAALAAWALQVTYSELPMWTTSLIGIALAAIILFTLGQSLPRAIATANPERTALASSRWALRLTEAAFPLARALSAPWLYGARLLGKEEQPAVPWSTSDEHRFGAEEEETGREETEEALIDAVTDFAEKIVREVMVPRTDITAIADTATVEEAIEVIEKAGYSRLPVYHETLDDIRGVLYAKDLLLRLRHGNGFVPAAIARTPYFVPETKPVEELLVEMRSTTHMAIVADEYGGTAGLVTIEDLLEEIVGEIFDEYDRQYQLVVDLGGGRFRVDARESVDDFSNRFGTDIELEADTIGGVFTETTGRIPAEGESVHLQGLRLTVESMEGNRIRQLIVEPVATDDDEEAHDDQGS